MIKLLLCLTTSLAIAVLVLQLRQQRLELGYQTNQLHNQIEDYQAKLWNQQLQIAMYTAPNAISKTVGDAAIHMVPQSPLPSNKQVNWIDAGNDPDAE
jgi:cell division protein FtsL